MGGGGVLSASLFQNRGAVSSLGTEEQFLLWKLMSGFNLGTEEWFLLWEQRSDVFYIGNRGVIFYIGNRGVVATLGTEE